MVQVELELIHLHTEQPGCAQRGDAVVRLQPMQPGTKVQAIAQAGELQRSNRQPIAGQADFPHAHVFDALARKTALQLRLAERCQIALDVVQRQRCAQQQQDKDDNQDAQCRHVR